MTPVLLRPVAWGDIWLLRAWRNDRSTRVWMFSDRHVGLAEHARWFLAVKVSGGSHVFVAMADGVPVGSVRFRFVARLVAEFSVLVAPGHRGKGYGAGMIRLAVRQARNHGAMRARALIREHNVPSRKAFERAGFVVRSVRDGVCEMVRPC